MATMSMTLQPSAIGRIGNHQQGMNVVAADDRNQGGCGTGRMHAVRELHHQDR